VWTSGIGKWLPSCTWHRWGWILCSVFGLSLQEIHWGDGMHPKKSNEAGECSGAQVSWGAAEGTEVFQSGEEEAERRSYHSTTTWKVVVAKWVLVSFPRQQVIGWKEMASNCIRESLDWILGNIFSPKGLSSVIVWLRLAIKGPCGSPSPRWGAEEDRKKQAKTGGSG